MFRYSLQQYNDSLITMGSIRVGTLHDFRRSEHKKGISDPQEGKKTLQHSIDEREQFDSDDHRAKMLEELVGIKLAKGGKADLSFVDIQKNFDHPDCFILCSSMQYSLDTMSQFEEANSCLEIYDQKTFYDVLTETLNRDTPVIFHGSFKVKYQSRVEKWTGKDWGQHPALIKEPEFSEQYELRAIWQPRDDRAIQPQKLVNFKLGACCRWRYKDGKQIPLPPVAA
jgi:hypothetical protein